MHEELLLEHIESVFHLLNVHAAAASPTLARIVIGDQVLFSVVEKICPLLISFS